MGSGEFRHPGQLGLVTTEPLLAQPLTEDDLRRAVEHAELVVIDSYDGDGHVFFERRTAAAS